MKVYIVETGCYDQSGIAGVYASAELAMKHYPCRKPNPQVVAAWKAYREGKGPQIGTCEREGGWQGNEADGWSNGLDWSDAASITAYEVFRDPARDDSMKAGIGKIVAQFAKTATEANAMYDAIAALIVKVEQESQ